MVSINTCDVDEVTVMSNAINDCICQWTCITTKLVVPVLKFVLRTEDGCGFLPSSMETFKDVPLL